MLKDSILLVCYMQKFNTLWCIRPPVVHGHILTSVETLCTGLVFRPMEIVHVPKYQVGPLLIKY